MDILSLFFPKRCVGCKKAGSYVCANCFATIDYSPELICAVCSRPGVNGLTHPGCKKSRSIDGVFSAVAYKGVVKRIMYQYKFEPYLSDLTHLLGDILYEGLIQYEPLSGINKQWTAIVPIPLHADKLRKRGYNQALLLAQELSRKGGIEMKDVLMRNKKTLPQSDLKREGRVINLQNAFQLKRNITAEGVLLVDDIVTSGATLNEAAKVLKKHGVKHVFGVTFAHGQ